MASTKLARGARVKMLTHNKIMHMKISVISKLKEYVYSSKGNLITVRPSKIAQEISTVGRVTRADGVIIRNFLEQLVERGYMEVIKRSARGKVYGIRRGGEFWELLMTHSSEDIVNLISMEE